MGGFFVGSTRSNVSTESSWGPEICLIKIGYGLVDSMYTLPLSLSLTVPGRTVIFEIAGPALPLDCFSAKRLSLVNTRFRSDGPENDIVILIIVDCSVEL